MTTETKEAEKLNLDCTAGEGSRQGRIKKDSPDYDEFSEFQRATVLAAKTAPPYSTVKINGITFVLLGNHSARGGRGTSCIVFALVKDDGTIDAQRYFFDWSKTNGAVITSVEFPKFEVFKTRKLSVQKMNFSPIPTGTGATPEWLAACKRGEFLSIERFFDERETNNGD